MFIIAEECKRQEMFPTEENIMSDFDFDATVLSKY